MSPYWKQRFWKASTESALLESLLADLKKSQKGSLKLSSILARTLPDYLGPENLTAAVSTDGCLRLVETGSGRVVREQQLGHGDLRSVAFAPNGEQLAIGSADGCLCLVETGSGRVVREQQLGHGNLWSVAFAPNGEKLAIGSHDGCLCLLETGSGRVVREQQLGHGYLRSMAFAPNGEQLAIDSDDCCLRLVETGSGGVVREQQLGHGILWSVAFAPNGEKLAIGSHDGCLCLVETGSGRVVREQQLGHGDLRSVAFAPNGEKLAIGSHDGCLCLVETGSGRVVREQQLGHCYLRSVAFAPNGEQLAIDDGCLCLVETGSGRVVREQQLGDGILRSVAFAPNGEQLAIGSDDGCLCLVETGSGRVVREQQLGHGYLRSVAFAPEARTTQCAQNNVSRLDPRVIENVHHWDPPATISEGEATTLVEQQWSSWVDFLNEVQPEELFTAYDDAPSETRLLNTAVGKPLEYGEKVFLINLSRVVPEYQRAMRLGRDFEPVRTALDEFGHRSCIDPPGAHMFVQPVQYMAVRDLCRTVDLKPHHIIISHAFVPLLLDALRSLPSKKHVRIRFMSPLAIVSDGGEDLIIVEKTFFVRRSQNQRSPRSVTQSSGVAHGIDNPRRSA